MKVVILDYETLGLDLDLSVFDKYGKIAKYPTSSEIEAKTRLADADVVVLNKTPLTAEVLACAPNLKLICKTATGYDNVDVNYCKTHGIRLTNTPAYSTNSVAQVTVTMACMLLTKLNVYKDFVRSGEYFKSVSANKLTPTFNQFDGLTWGIVGFGNIGKKVAKIAEALGCKILINSQTIHHEAHCVTLSQILLNSDVISLHCPLTDQTRGLIGVEQLKLLKKSAILINVARGAVWDEQAVANALLDGKIGGIGCDVFTQEPITPLHPFAKILHLDNAILTPHMAWGSVQSRNKCINMVVDNIDAFFAGKPTNIVV